MTNSEFNKILNARCKKMKDTLKAKADEYATPKDILHNFKVAARVLNITPEKALQGMAIKHAVSVQDIIERAEDAVQVTIAGEMSTPHPTYVEESTIDPKVLDEKIGDCINYLVLLEAILLERIN